MDACQSIKGKLSNSDVKIVLRDMYEDHYGIYPHLKKGIKNRPLASVALHPCENRVDNSILEEAMDVYLKSNILEYFGLNWNEYITQPKEIIDVQIKLASKKMSEKSSNADSIESRLRQEMASINGNKKAPRFKTKR